MKDSRPPAYFEALYAANPDPWDFETSPYEAGKYAATLAALGSRRFGAALEVGCSIGVFTTMLAPFCNELLAIDGSPRALSHARGRCGTLPHVRFEERFIPQDWPAQKFDLVLLSEVLYFLTPSDIAHTAAMAKQSLNPGGLILLVNYRGQITEPCTGDAAAYHFIEAFGGDHKTLALEENYRIDTLF